jgi:hypothetical protein
MALKVLPTHRADQVVVGKSCLFQYWWKNGRPYDVRVSSDDEALTVEHLRTFVAWCDSLPDLKPKE